MAADKREGYPPIQQGPGANGSGGALPSQESIEVLTRLLPPAHHAQVLAQLQQPLAVLGRDRHELDSRAPQIVAGAPNSCSTSGTATVPSSRWWFSAIAMIVRPTATAVPLSVCTGRGEAPSSGR